jgi:hypothetical protein
MVHDLDASCKRFKSVACVCTHLICNSCLVLSFAQAIGWSCVLDQLREVLKRDDYPLVVCHYDKPILCTLAL